MTKKCPNCNAPLGKGAVLSLLIAFKCRCKNCKSNLKSQSLWDFVLSIVVVFVTIASLGDINLFGTYGFLVAGIIPIILFFVGRYFIPLKVT